jgi:hypothetical protein
VTDNLWYWCDRHRTNVVKVGAIDESQMLRFHRNVYGTRCVFEKVKREGM